MGTNGKTAEEGARRLRKPGWKDPRLIVGTLIVLASVAGTAALVAGLDETTPMYVAKADIPLGGPVTADSLAIANVRLEGLADRYLGAGAAPAPGTRANTLLRAGHLIPVGDLGLPGTGNRRPVSIELPKSLPAAITTGARVDVWVALRDKTANGYAVPTLLLQATEVSARRELESGFGGSQGEVIELLVPDDKLAPLLDAMANEAHITVVFNPSATTP
ncbi:hypothetical protein [Paeniglutamicibacter cryotolerans]|uniref:SAF domain-containing protein n=1 Tax=Paeniglutamicibacter cryotolerans TaxID=670079 RepID=A0A839QPB4_9MICC|nr:hypothetical protein [Paeniglutamicibacter cryotolerans]MBB2996614.1 hypothetical protein [Paeniglutamicibacter cryotolerans]